MNKLTIIRCIAFAGMVLFFAFGLAGIAVNISVNYPMLISLLCWAIFGMWARRLSFQSDNGEAR